MSIRQPSDSYNAFEPIDVGDRDDDDFELHVDRRRRGGGAAEGDGLRVRH
jgi:hypothetical protein